MLVRGLQVTGVGAVQGSSRPGLRGHSWHVKEARLYTEAVRAREGFKLGGNEGFIWHFRSLQRYFRSFWSRIREIMMSKLGRGSPTQKTTVAP